MSDDPKGPLPFPDRRTGIDRRGAGRDRRTSARGGRRATDFIVAGLAGFQLFSLAGRGQAAEKPQAPVVRSGRRATDVAGLRQPLLLPPARLAVPVRFGTEIKSLARAQDAGLSFAYGVTWTGAWNQKYGWKTPQENLREARKRGVTPIVHWWYWGDEISPAAVEKGVTDMRHKVRKDRETWFRMAGELADLLKREMGDREAVVVLETEFNKAGIENYEPFDGYLAEQARLFHSRGNIKVVLGFGNWGRSRWSSFDRAIAESDMLGTQLLRSSVRDPAAYLKAVDTLVEGARTLDAKFGKPVMIMDLALSSFPSGDYERLQANVLAEMFRRIGELKAAGVNAVIWRQIVDDPDFDTSNYHGQAERHWGVLRADGSPKPAFEVLRQGIQAEVRGAT